MGAGGLGVWATSVVGKRKKEASKARDLRMKKNSVEVSEGAVWRGGEEDSGSIGRMCVGMEAKAGGKCGGSVLAVGWNVGWKEKIGVQEKKLDGKECSE